MFDLCVVMKCVWYEMYVCVRGDVCVVYEVCVSLRCKGISECVCTCVCVCVCVWCVCVCMYGEGMYV